MSAREKKNGGHGGTQENSSNSRSWGLKITDVKKEKNTARKGSTDYFAATVGGTESNSLLFFATKAYFPCRGRVVK